MYFSTFTKTNLVFIEADGRRSLCTLPPLRHHPAVKEPHKLDFLLKQTRFTIGSLERDAASTGTHLFLLALQWTQLIDWLWFDI